jgi:hypothetical protein
MKPIKRDSKYPNMWRVWLGGGEWSDILNLSRAKDLAREVYLASRVAAPPK